MNVANEARVVIRGMSTSSRNAHTSAYYGVATISRLLKIIGLFCKRAP